MRRGLGESQQGSHLLGGTQLALQMFNLLLGLPDAPQGILIGNLLALPPIPFLQLPDAAPQLINLRPQGSSCHCFLLMLGWVPVSTPPRTPPHILPPKPYLPSPQPWPCARRP